MFKAAKTIIRSPYKYTLVSMAILLCVLSGVGCGGGNTTELTLPSAAFSATPTSGDAPLSVQFTDASSDATAWSWDFDNNGTADSTVQNPTHLYSIAGTYTVKLTVMGDGGSDNEIKTDYITVTTPSITPAILTAGFTFLPTSGDAPLMVQFTDTSTGGATSWSWDFNNDGAADSTSQNPQHTYNTAGSYYIKLNIGGAGGATAHMIHQITLTAPVIPYVYDPDWWNDERLVWYYGQPLGSGQQQYYDAMTQTGVGAVSWLDLRFTANWETTIGQIVTKCHNMGIPAVGTLSMINTYQEQVPETPELQATITVDPFENQITFPGFGFPIHSMIHPDWVDYLKDCIERTIDLGVDGFLIDELCYGNVYNPDFSANTMEMFRQWLEVTYPTVGEQITKGIDPIADYDYAEAVRVHLALNTDPITIESWTWDLWGSLPLSGDYQRFLREANRDTAEQLVAHAKSYAQTTYDKTISVTANLSDMTAPEALYIVDLLDYINLEWHYISNVYFPTGRAFATVKLADAFGVPATILADMATRSDIVAKGAEDTVNLYKTMIADAYAGGGAFHLEEGGHGIEQDLTELASYYNFVPDNPGLFNGLTLAEDDIGVLHMWEAIDPFKAEAYRGMCNLLADTGYQFETIFGAEDYTWWNEQIQTPPPPGQELVLEDLTPYEVIIIPELHDITPHHADLLLLYVNGGGTAIVFAATSDTDTLQDHRNESSPNTHINTLLSNLNAGENIYGSGKIIRYNSIWGTDYLENLTASLKTDIKTKLSGEGLKPTVNLVSNPKVMSAFAYKATGKQVIHLVNYNYNAGTDTTTSVTGLDIDIDLGDLSEIGLTVTYYTPETPEGAVVPDVVVSGGIASITVPQLDIWGVLVMVN